MIVKIVEKDHPFRVQVFEADEYRITPSDDGQSSQLVAVKENRNIFEGTIQRDIDVVYIMNDEGKTIDTIGFPKGTIQEEKRFLKDVIGNMVESIEGAGK